MSAKTTGQFPRDLPPGEAGQERLGTGRRHPAEGRSEHLLRRLDPRKIDADTGL
jgi:hypothetical protein